MGYNIHAHIEIKVKNNWMYFAPANIKRNYIVFAKMADAAPRGLPEDITSMVKLHREHWGIDGHSDSWLSWDELVLLIDWLQKNHPRKKDFLNAWQYTFFGENTWLFGSTFYSRRKYLDSYPDFIEDIRLVFWFGN